LEFAGDHADFPVAHGSGRLVYAERPVDTNIWRIDVSGSSAKSMTPERFVASTRKEMFPQFSPDGERILYLSDRSGSIEIWVANADGTNPIQLTSMSAPIVGAPRWSPDGERIVFDSNRDGRWEIYVIHAAGGAPQRMTNHPADDCCGSWSHDGRWIYFMSARSGQRQIWKMRAGGGEVVQITKQGGHVALESTDGRFLYYSVRGGEGERNGLGALRRVPVNGGDEMEVLPSVTFYNFAVRPQGLFFIPRAEAESGSAIHFFSFASRKSRPVATVTATEPGISVSPDGRWLLYSQADEGRSDLMLAENFR
jgi:Tol biopolymer transport system component